MYCFADFICGWKTQEARKKLSQYCNESNAPCLFPCQVEVRENNDTAEQLKVWLVSYSGVGAVVTVVVSYNGSNGTLYSSAVSYGCNFIDAAEYRCTKLGESLLWCPSLMYCVVMLCLLAYDVVNNDVSRSSIL